MNDPSRPVCPTCGSELRQRETGDLVCVQHGTLVGHRVLDEHFGAGTSASVARAAAFSAQSPRKCPLDRYAMSRATSASGASEGDACGRCGSVWVPWSSVDEAARRAPMPSAASPAAARSLMALAVARAIARVAPPARR